jgi:hypothetical protein
MKESGVLAEWKTQLDGLLYEVGHPFFSKRSGLFLVTSTGIFSQTEGAFKIGTIYCQYSQYSTSFFSLIIVGVKYKVGHRFTVVFPGFFPKTRLKWNSLKSRNLFFMLSRWGILSPPGESIDFLHKSDFFYTAERGRGILKNTVPFYLFIFLSMLQSESLY